MTDRPWESPPTGAAREIAAEIAAAVPELKTPRLRLRAPRMKDFDAFAEILTTARGIHVGGPMPRETAWLEFTEAVSGWLLRGYGMWSVERRADGALLGFLPLHHEAGDPEPELGYLFLASAEGQGYATEAAEAARDFAFGRLGWSRLISYIAPENARSIAVAERLGAKRADDERHPLDADLLIFRHPKPESS